VDIPVTVCVLSVAVAVACLVGCFRQAAKADAAAERAEAAESSVRLMAASLRQVADEVVDCHRRALARAAGRAN
jgi:hypothetical protein